MMQDTKMVSVLKVLLMQECAQNMQLRFFSIPASCSSVRCGKPYQECVEQGSGKAALCQCPDCSGGSSESESRFLVWWVGILCVYVYVRVCGFLFILLVLFSFWIVFFSCSTKIRDFVTSLSNRK